MWNIKQKCVTRWSVITIAPPKALLALKQFDNIQQCESRHTPFKWRHSFKTARLAGLIASRWWKSHKKHAPLRIPFHKAIQNACAQSPTRRSERSPFCWSPIDVGASSTTTARSWGCRKTNSSFCLLRHGWTETANADRTLMCYLELFRVRAMPGIPY